jgi:hypothetical protein
MASATSAAIPDPNLANEWWGHTDTVSDEAITSERRAKCGRVSAEDMSEVVGQGERKWIAAEVYQNISI